MQILLVGVTACGGGAPPPEVVIEKERPEDQILRLGRVWEVRAKEKGFLSPPSPISLFDVDVTDTLRLEPKGERGLESLRFDEHFKTRDGGTFECRTSIETPVKVRYGWRRGEAAVEIQRPSVRAARTCDPSGFPDPILSREARTSRFVLRDDQLVGVEPADEKRRFIPTE